MKESQEGRKEGRNIASVEGESVGRKWEGGIKAEKALSYERGQRRRSGKKNHTLSVSMEFLTSPGDSGTVFGCTCENEKKPSWR
jgi:hypothetical protein